MDGLSGSLGAPQIYFWEGHDWHDIYEHLRTVNTRLKYAKQETESAAPLLQDLLDPDLATMHPKLRKFRANRSMRDVEQNVELTVKPLNDWQ